MINEQKNNNTYLASILTIFLLASSIPFFSGVQAEDMSDNITLLGDAQGNKSFASFNGTASYSIVVTSDSDISLTMGLRYIENSTGVIDNWNPESAIFIYGGQVSTSNLTLNVDSGTHQVTVSIAVPSNSEGEFIEYPDSFDARFGFCNPAPCDYNDTNTDDWIPRLGIIEVRDWVVLADEDISLVDAGGSSRLDSLVLRNLLRDEAGYSVRLSQSVTINTDVESLPAGVLTAFDDSGLDYDYNWTDAGQNYITIDGLADEEMPLPLDVILSPTAGVVYCPSTPSIIGFKPIDNEGFRQFEDGGGPVPALGITANPYSGVSFSSDSISKAVDTWDGEEYVESEANFDFVLENGGNIYDSFDVSIALDSDFPQDWSIVANLDGALPFNDDVNQVHRTEELEYLNAASRPCNSLYWESDADRDSLNLAIKIIVPANSPANFVSGATLLATSVFDNTVRTEQYFSLSIAQHYAVSVDATSLTTVQTDPESTAQFNFTVTNIGNGEDVFDIHTTAPSEWNPTLSTSTITLQVSEVYNVHMTMTVPEDMLFGDSSGAIKIGAQSNGDPADEWEDDDNDGVWDQGQELLTVDHNGNNMYDSGTYGSVYVQVQVSQVHDIEFNYYVNESKVQISTIEIYTQTLSFLNINATNVGNGNDQIRFELTNFSHDGLEDWLTIVQDVEYMSPGDSITISIKAEPYLTTTPDTYSFTVTAMSYGTINSGESQVLTIVLKQRETLIDQDPIVEDIDEGGLLGIPGFETVGALLALAALSVARRPKL